MGVQNLNRTANKRIRTLYTAYTFIFLRALRQPRFVVIFIERTPSKLASGTSRMEGNTIGTTTASTTGAKTAPHEDDRRIVHSGGSMAILQEAVVALSVEITKLEKDIRGMYIYLVCMNRCERVLTRKKCIYLWIKWFGNRRCNIDRRENTR